MGRKPNRSESQAETLTVRMSPRTKYGLELIARSQRRTLASVAEWLFVEGMRSQSLTSLQGNPRLVAHVLEELWDPYEADRLVKLALKYPLLLTYEEDLLWKVIKEIRAFWVPKELPAQLTHKEMVDVLEGALERRDPQIWEPNLRAIRAQWDGIQAAAKGEKVKFKSVAKEG